MEGRAEPDGAAAAHAPAGARRAPAAAAFALGALPVALLAIEDGGYGAIVRGQAGVLAWFAVLLGAATGLLPRRALPRRALVGAGLLIAYGAWAAIGIPGSEAAGRTVEEVGRIATLAGVLVLALLLRTAGGTRPALGGMAAAITGVAVVALAYRVVPDAFPPGADLALPGARGRLSYPLGYWNGLAALMALGLPLLLTFAAGARGLAVRALAGAPLPLLVLVVGLTLSRGGFALLAVAAIAWVALRPHRLTGALAVAGTAVLGALLVAAAYARDELVDGTRSDLAASQGGELLLLVLLAAAAGAGLAVLLARLEPGLEGRARRLPRGALLGGGAAVLIAAALLAVALGGPGAVRDRWSEFRTPDIPVAQKASPGRLTSASGTGRAQFWEAAIDAGNSAPLTGTGAGTWGLWWGREAPVYLFARDAHSLPLESYAELGIVGALLIVGFVLLVLGAGVRDALRGPAGGRETAAAATAAFAVFAVGSAIDWQWELTILPAAALVLAALLLGGAADEPPGRAAGVRAGAAVLAVAALVAVAVPLLAATALRDSRALAARGDLRGALDAATSATDAQPSSAEAWLQRALVLERAGDLDRAAASAARASREEPGNWRIWAVRARIDAGRGRTAAALRAFRRARALAGPTPGLTRAAGAAAPAFTAQGLARCLRRGRVPGERLKVTTRRADLDEIARAAGDGAVRVRFDVAPGFPDGITGATLAVEETAAAARATQDRYAALFRALNAPTAGRLRRVENVVVAYEGDPTAAQRAVVRRCLE